jgi:hypothetical protein
MYSAISFGKNPPNFLNTCKSIYGSIFTLQLGPKKMTFLTNPYDYHIIGKNHTNLSFSDISMEICIRTFGVDVKSLTDPKVDIEVKKTKYIL